MSFDRDAEKAMHTDHDRHARIDAGVLDFGTERAMRADYDRAARIRWAAAIAPDVDERETLNDWAGRIDTAWSESPWKDDWAYLAAAHAEHVDDPARARAATAAARDTLSDREQRSRQQARYIADWPPHKPDTWNDVKVDAELDWADHRIARLDRENQQLRRGNTALQRVTGERDALAAKVAELGAIVEQYHGYHEQLNAERDRLDQDNMALHDQLNHTADHGHRPPPTPTVPQASRAVPVTPPPPSRGLRR